MGVWNLRPTPRRAISASDMPVISAFANVTLPAVGRVLPLITSQRVVLPAPLGPMMTRNSKGSNSNESMSRALKPSKRTLMLLTFSRLPSGAAVSLVRFIEAMRLSRCWMSSPLDFGDSDSRPRRQLPADRAVDARKPFSEHASYGAVCRTNCQSRGSVRFNNQRRAACKGRLMRAPLDEQPIQVSADARIHNARISVEYGCRQRTRTAS